MLLLPSTVDEALKKANKLRELIIEETSVKDGIPEFTCSFGVINLLEYSNFELAYKAVDKKLYKAKKKGRNQVQ